MDVLEVISSENKSKLVDNITKMFTYRSVMRNIPEPIKLECGDNFLAMYNFDDKKIIVTHIYKFTTKHYSSLSSEYYYIILTNKALHYELRKQLQNCNNIEIFPTNYFMFNIQEMVPKHSLFSEERPKEWAKLPKLLQTDPMVLYGKFKKGELLIVADQLRVVV